MAKKKINATAELFLNTKNAESDASKFVNGLKQKLLALETAADKMTVFKDMVDYIGSVDRALGDLKAKNADAFNSMFDGIDEALKQKIEGVFGTTKSQLGQLDILREKLNTLNTKSSITELRSFAKEINALFDGVGVDSPLANINDIFSGRVTEDHLKTLSNALGDFATVWDGVMQKIGAGFGTGGAGGGFSAEVQSEIDKMQKQIDGLKALKDDMARTLKNKQAFDTFDTITLEVEATSDAVANLVQQYKQLAAESANLAKGTEDYNKNVAARAKIGLQLSALRDSEEDIDLSGVSSIVDSDDFDDMLQEFESATSSLFSKIDTEITTIQGKISEIKRNGLSTGSSGDGTLNYYDQLKTKLKEYYNILEQRENEKIGTTRYEELTTQLEDLSESVLKLKDITDNDKMLVKDVFGDIEYGEIASFEDALTQICNLLQVQLPAAASGDGSGPLGKMVDEAEYVQGIAIQLEKLFGNINTLSGTIEYKVLVNGQEIDIKQGGSKEVSEQTRIESYLGTLGKKTYVSAHNHPGGTSSNYDHYDFRSTIDDIYGGVASMGMVVSENDVTTLNLANVALEDAMQVYEKIKELGDVHVSAEQINEMFAAINPTYANVAQKWNPSQFGELAQFIYDVGENAHVAIDPLEKFQNVLKIATGGKIDLSKYENLLDNFKVDDAGFIFNKIMEMEGKELRVGDINTTSLSEFVNAIKQQQDALAQLRNDADVTYSDIHNMVKTYLSEVSTGSGVGEGASAFIKQYFDRSDQSIISDWLIELENGEASIIQVTNRIAGYFNNIDPDAYLKDTVVTAQQQMEEFFALTNEIKDKEFQLYGAEDNVEIGKYTERLESARNALRALADQGEITAEDLSKIDLEFDFASSRLKAYTTDYTGYGSGYEGYSYSYEDEYMQEKRDNETLRDDLEKAKEEIETLKTELAKKTTGTSSGGELIDDSGEIGDLENLRKKIIEVESAVRLKTEAFNDESIGVSAVVDKEIESLTRLLEWLNDIKQLIDQINLSEIKINTENIDGNTGNTGDNVGGNISAGYALNSTLLDTNGILGQILNAIGNNESIAQLLDPLSSAATELKNVANGIIEHKKAQQTNRSESGAKIAGNYNQLYSIAGNAVASLGDETKVKQMRALADGVVRVEGAVRNADGAWKGFIVDIDESNNAVLKAVDEQSAYAEALNKAAEAAKTASKDVSAKNKFAEALTAQKRAFAEYKNDLKDVDYLTDDLQEGIKQLGIKLDAVADTDGLSSWKDAFANMKDDIDLVASHFENTEKEKLRLFRGSMNSEFKTLDFSIVEQDPTDEQKEILALREKMIMQLDTYNAAIKNGKSVELDSLNATMSELREKINLYRQANDLESGSRQKYGSNAVLAATAKMNSLRDQATNGEFANSSIVQKSLQEVEAAYNSLIEKRREFANTSGSLSDTQKSDFKRLQTEYNNLYKELNKIITSSQQLERNGLNSSPINEDFDDSIEARKAALREFVQETYNVSVATDSFKKNFTECTFAIENGDGTITQMTASLNAARTAIVATAGDTQKVTGAFESFMNLFKTKLKQVFAYTASSFGIQEIIQQVRKGIQYVRDIDLALTELKKVTDATEESYARFLDTASQTASKIGSTVADFTNATADFARLGYNIEQASMLAKAASVYKNVGDGIEDVAAASESIISTMKAYGIEAENTMGIVDRFNEVGNNFAISSTGIGEALQRSASALHEGGNTIDESIALVTAAM